MPSRFDSYNMFAYAFNVYEELCDNEPRTYTEAIKSEYAEKWKHTTGGWIILWLMIFTTAFPPMIGYGSCGTLAGFVYGIGEGWVIYTTATIAGSYCSFIVCRTVLRKYVERMVANDKRFAALTLTLKEDGLKLLCMIRLCPLPYSLSNGAMSTFPTVRPEMYALACPDSDLALADPTGL